MEPKPGHEGVLTTFTSYGSVRADLQGEIIRRLAQRGNRPNDEETLRALELVSRMIQRNGLDVPLPPLPQR